MKNIIRNIKSPAFISLLITLPFAILELANRQNIHEGFPFPLFFMLWLLSIAFILILMPIVRNIQAGNSLMAHPVSLLVRVALLIILAIIWGSLLIDQMPCFMGVPNCD